MEPFHEVSVRVVHDSVLVETDMLARQHHWIEEGSYDDFKACILSSNLPALAYDQLSRHPAVRTALDKLSNLSILPVNADRAWIQADLSQIEQRVFDRCYGVVVDNPVLPFRVAAA